MKLLSFIIITAALVLGAISAGTAYLPRVEAIDGSMELTLNAAAGRDPADASKPLVDPAEAETPVRLTDELIAQLRAADVRRVQVKQFAFSRWDGRWWFILACVGLLAGAGIVRRSAAQAIARTLATERPPTETPEHALQTAHDQVAELRRSLETVQAEDMRSQMIVDTLDTVQREHLDVVSEAAAELIVRLGPAGHARLMDRFAAAERQLNRAWSAAADGVLEEAMVCLERGETLLEEAKERLEA